MFLQDTPKRPHYLDLPNITDTEKQKLTHKDFYTAKDNAKKEKDAEQKVHADQVDKAFADLLNDSEFKSLKESTEMAKISEDPFSKWQALYYIDNIKERNRPLDAQAKKQDAPFFLFDLDAVLQENDGTKDLYGVQYFTGKKEMDDESKALTSIIQESKHLEASKDQAVVGQQLKNYLEKYSKGQINSKQILDYLKGISPSAIELEVMSLTDYEFDTNKEIDYVSKAPFDTFYRSKPSSNSLRK